uniref:Uncharacterized protein n=1 Tax=Crocodylus porosus TaxID=8502 RepID=A0A7M4FAF0_CROPO
VHTHSHTCHMHTPGTHLPQICTQKHHHVYIHSHSHSFMDPAMHRVIYTHMGTYTWTPTQLCIYTGIPIHIFTHTEPHSGVHTWEHLYTHSYNLTLTLTDSKKGLDKFLEERCLNGY